MNRKWTWTAWALTLTMATACADLEVTNLNDPDRERALATASDIESLIAGTFLSWWLGAHDFAPGPALSVMGDEHTASWGNFGMRDMSWEPRREIDNQPSYSYAYVIEDPWQLNYACLSANRDGINAINGGIDIGTDGQDTQRAMAFARFTQGLCMAHLALLYDKAFIVDENTDIATTSFSSYSEVMTAALDFLDQAAQIASSNSFTLPAHWMASVQLNSDELAALAYSYKARFRAQVARNETERAAVDWNAVIMDLDRGITSDFVPIGDGSNAIWYDVLKMWGGTRPGWARVDVRLLGPSDQSGGFQSWLTTPVDSRTEFEIDTDDRRVTGDGGPQTDGIYFQYEGPSPFRPERGTYHFSLYGDARWKPYNAASGVGDMDEMTMPELDMLRAEALYRLGGNETAVIDLINLTRTANGQLSAVTIDGDQTARCVPRTDAGDCGDLWEALKYEKRIENFHTGMGIHYFDDRGWGDLVEGTALHFPVPGIELLTLLQDIYTFGGPGGDGAAPDVITPVNGKQEIDWSVRAKAYKAFQDRYHARRLALIEQQH